MPLSPHVTGGLSSGKGPRPLMPKTARKRWLQQHPVETVQTPKGLSLLVLYKGILPNGRIPALETAERARAGIPSVKAAKKPVALTWTSSQTFEAGAGLYRTKDDEAGFHCSTLYHTLITSAALGQEAWRILVNEDDVVEWGTGMLLTRRMLLKEKLTWGEIWRTLRKELPIYDKMWSELSGDDWNLLKDGFYWAHRPPPHPPKLEGTDARDRLKRLVTTVVRLANLEGWQIDDVRGVVLVRGRVSDREFYQQVEKLRIETGYWKALTWNFPPFLQSYLHVAPMHTVYPDLADIRKVVKLLAYTAPVGQVVREMLSAPLIGHLSRQAFFDASPLEAEHNRKLRTVYVPWINLIGLGFVPVGVDGRQRLVLAI